MTTARRNRIFQLPNADFFYPAIFKKYRAKMMETPDFVPISEAPASKRLVEISNDHPHSSSDELVSPQTLRTALAMSCITGRPFHLRNFAGLHTKGLQNVVVAAGEICQAKIYGYEPGTQELRFHPAGRKLLEQTRAIKHVEVEATESVTDVLNCLLPVLWFTPGSGNALFVVGGTNIPGEQSLDAFCEGTLRMLRIPSDGFSIERDAPSPPVLGSFQIQVKPPPPSSAGKGIDLRERGALLSAQHVVAHGDRQALASTIASQLRQQQQCTSSAAKVEETVSVVEVSEEFKSQASGPCVVSRLEFEHHVQVFSRAFQPGETLQSFVQQVVQERVQYCDSHTAPVLVDFAHLLLLPLVCTQHGATFRTNGISDKFVQECRVLAQFLGKSCCEYTQEDEEGTFLVRVFPTKLTTTVK